MGQDHNGQVADAEQRRDGRADDQRHGRSRGGDEGGHVGHHGQHGLTSPGYAYQWIRVDGSTEADISGATSSIYTPVAADLGKTIKVKVSFTDDASNAETLTSAATTAVDNGPDHHQHLRLQHQPGQRRDWSDSVSRAQSFTTGSQSGGYTVTSVDIGYDDAEGDKFSAAIWTVDSDNEPDDGDNNNKVADLTAPTGTWSAGDTLTFTAPAGTTLDAGTTYAVVLTMTGNAVRLDSTTSDDEDSGAFSGWSIADTGYFISSNTWTANPTEKHCASRSRAPPPRRRRLRRRYDHRRSPARAGRAPAIGTRSIISDISVNFGRHVPDRAELRRPRFRPASTRCIQHGGRISAMTGAPATRPPTWTSQQGTVRPTTPQRRDSDRHLHPAVAAATTTNPAPTSRAATTTPHSSEVGQRFADGSQSGGYHQRRHWLRRRPGDSSPPPLPVDPGPTAITDSDHLAVTEGWPPTGQVNRQGELHRRRQQRRDADQRGDLQGDSAWRPLATPTGSTSTRAPTTTPAAAF